MKVFCIGRNKTGTTSMEGWMSNAGLKVCPQPKGEDLLREWANGSYKPFEVLSTTFDGFQDICWNLDGVPQAMYKMHPDAFFILTMRENADVWYRSLIRYMNNTKPKKMAGYSREERHKLIYGCSILDEKQTKKHYNDYNRKMIDFFESNNANFMQLTIPSSNISERLADFTGLKVVRFPHANKSK